MDLSDVAALALAAISLVVAVGGTTLSNRRSKEGLLLSREALEDARGAKADGLWSAAIEAVLRIVGFDPAIEPVGDRLRTLAISLTALTDGLDVWDGLDEWFAAEHALGALYGREVMAGHRPGDTPEQRLAALAPYMDWGLAFSQNLRHLRNTGYDATAVTALTSNAERACSVVNARNGWTPSPGPNLTPFTP